MDQQINKMQDTYEGNVTSAQYNGDATLIIDETGLTVSALFSDIGVGYEQITAIRNDDYKVHVVTEIDTFCCSRLGQSNDWFFNKLSDAYNNAVTSALKVKGECLFETKGNVAYENINSKGKIQVYEDCICLLPPMTDARRFPFAFMSGLKKENYTLSIQLITGEGAVISMVGRDLDPLEKCIVERVRAIREKNSALAESLCEGLSVAEKSRAANLMAEKLAVPLAKLNNLPNLHKSVIEKIAISEMKNSWKVLNELCDAEKIAVGIWKLSDEEVAKLKEQLLQKLQEEAGSTEEGAQTIELTPEQEEALKWMIWVAAPSKDGKTCVVEAAFPTEEVATYVYSVPCGWDIFLNVLNRAMEAMDFDRETILISKEKMAEGANASKKMLIERTPAIEVLRGQFLGRIIHRTEESWQKNLKEYLNRS